MRSILASTSAIVGSRPSGLELGELRPRPPARHRALRGFRARCRRARRLAASWRSSPRAASARASPTASSAARAALSASAKLVLGRGQPVGGGAALAGRGFDLADQRLALARQIFAARFRARCARFAASSLRLPMVAICAAALSLRSFQACALGGNGLQPAIGKSRPRARSPAPRPALRRRCCARRRSLR